MLLIDRHEEGCLLIIFVNEEEPLWYPVLIRNFLISKEGNGKHESMAAFRKVTLWVWCIIILYAIVCFLSSYLLRTIAEKTRFCCCRAHATVERQKMLYFASCSISTIAAKPTAFPCWCWDAKKEKLTKFVFYSFFPCPSNEINLAAWQVPKFLFEFHSDQISWGRPLQGIA